MCRPSIVSEEPNNYSASKIFLNTEVETVTSGVQTLNSLQAKTLQKQIFKQRISDGISLTQNISKTSDNGLFLPDKEQGRGNLSYKYKNQYY